MYDKKYYEIMDKGYSGTGSIIFLTIIEELSKHKGEKILDAGCESGFYLPFISKQFKIVYGFDFSREGCEIAKQKIKRFKNVHVFQHDLTKKTKFKKSSFDVILCSEVLEHIYNLDASLKELKRILKINGTLIITVPNFTFLGHSYIEEKITEFFFHWKDPTHIHRYSIKKWENILKKYFFIEKVYTTTHYFSKILHKIGFNRNIVFKIDKLNRKLPLLNKLGRNIIFVLKNSKQSENDQL